MAEDYEYHPVFSSKFMLSLGAMKSTNSLKLAAGGADFDSEGEEIDFDEDLRVSDSTTYFNGQLRWNFGSKGKWSVWAQYFSNKATGNVTLEEDIEWNDVIFEEGSFVEAGVKLGITRVFFGRSMVKSSRQEFGVGFGIHNLDMSAYVEGEARFGGISPSLEYTRESVAGSQILPNLGTWYYFSPARNWLLHARVDWIGASIGDYSGALWNVTAGVNYQVLKNVGVNLYWGYFNLNGDVDSSDWRGSLDLSYSGPVLALDFTW